MIRACCCINSTSNLHRNHKVYKENLKKKHVNEPKHRINEYILHVVQRRAQMNSTHYREPSF